MTSTLAALLPSAGAVQDAGRGTAMTSTTIDNPSEGGFSTTPATFGAMTLYDALTTEQRARALLPFGSDDRDNWDFLPASGRRGLPLRDMTHRQQIVVHQLVGECLTPEAYARVLATINLEHVLRQVQAPVFGLSTAAFRDPGGYFFSLSGEPRCDATWGWRLVGHHVSLNFTFVEQRWLASTPMLIGAEPARFATWRHPAEEEDLGFALLGALSPGERDDAIIHTVSPADFVTRSVRRVSGTELPAAGDAGPARARPGRRRRSPGGARRGPPGLLALHGRAGPVELAGGARHRRGALARAPGGRRGRQGGRSRLHRPAPAAPCAWHDAHRLADLNTPVVVGGVTVEPGDLVVGDEHGDVLLLPAAAQAAFGRADVARRPGTDPPGRVRPGSGRSPAGAARRHA